MYYICLTPVYPALKSVSSIFVRGGKESLFSAGCGRRGSSAVGQPLAKYWINTRRRYCQREARSRRPPAVLGRSSRGMSVVCLECATLQSWAARTPGAEKPIDRTRRVRRVRFPGDAKRSAAGVSCALAGTHRCESPPRGFFRSLIQTPDKLRYASS